MKAQNICCLIDFHYIKSECINCSLCLFTFGILHIFDILFQMIRIRTCYLYEFLVGITLITVVFQIIAILDATKENAGLLVERYHPEAEYSPPKTRDGPQIANLMQRDRHVIPTNKSEANSTNILKTPVCTNETKELFKILVFGGIKVIRQWQELNVLVKTFKPVDKTSHALTITCPYERTTPKILLDETNPKNLSCESDVHVTLSSNMNELSDKDIILLGMSPYSLKIKTKVMRTKVSANQLFLFYGVETPLRMQEWISDVGRQPVHAVWSYGGSSETVIPYGRYVKFPDGDARDVDVKAITGNKTKLIAWMGSNCVKQVFWPRMAFVNELQKYVKVDTYGKCGNLSCLPRMSERCQHLMGEYKFYLSLENAECSDYMTEKFWDTALIQGAVPVVYGAKKEDYERLAPPGSFIHVSDFESIESLANYLLLLDRNDYLYQRFFHWRRKGEIQMNFPPLLPPSLCDVIQQYRLLKNGSLTARDLSETSWYRGCRLKTGEKHESDLASWRPWK